MDARQLARLERVSVREFWSHEAREFTPWLAQRENLQLLADAVQMDLVVEAQERAIGVFRADILARDSRTDQVVLIENQLGKTDHEHLGQVITYASGIQAGMVVWIAETFVNEHRAAVDWLNRVTNEQVRFFGVEIELWRIGTSPFAPKFNVVAKPNEWVRAVAATVRPGRESAMVEQIRALLAAEPGLSGRKIAERIGCSPTTAAKWKTIVEGESVECVNE